MGKRTDKESYELVNGCQGCVPAKQCLALPGTRQYIVNEASKPERDSTRNLAIPNWNSMEIYIYIAIWDNKVVESGKKSRRAAKYTIKIKCKMLEIKLATNR